MDYADHDVHSDCDSEGNAPPTDGEGFVDPATIDDRFDPPPRSVGGPLVLPLFQPAQRPRYSARFASRVGYEEWVEGATSDGARGRSGGVVGAAAGTGGAAEVRKLEEDSDMPIGQSYFWRASCDACPRQFFPHVPPAWTCTACNGRVWQGPDEPASRACGICQRSVSKMITVRGHKIRNPMLTNSHNCKRCGRIVCDNCYHATPVECPAFGYTEPVHVCKQCLVEAVERPPSEEDLGTLYDEHLDDDANDEGEGDGMAQYQPFWNPRCRSCNVTYGKPPPRWECPTCHGRVWQPSDRADATACWLCGDKFPKVQCHRCGRLVCERDGAYGQPLPEMGWDDGLMRTVCRVCYQGTDNKPPKDDDPRWKEDENEIKQRRWRAVCPTCRISSSGGGEINQWLSKCHRRRTWQPEDQPAANTCSCCSAAVASGAQMHCHRCGRIACHVCTQYKQPLESHGYPPGAGMQICKVCFNPSLALLPAHTDFKFWPPRCVTCKASWDTPPPCWQCTHHCGPVWQPQQHVASVICPCCGKKNSGAVHNCRCCGRLTCSACATGKTTVPERGFPPGALQTVCRTCAAEKAK